MEKTPEEYISKLVSIMQQTKRVLRDDGTLWLNLGDCYARNGGKPGGGNRELPHMEGTQSRMCSIPEGTGLKEKDLVGIPWMAAFALRADGWYLRQDIIWHKPNPMPESVTDRCTKGHEYVFMFSKQPKYYYDAAAIREQPSPALVKQVEEGYNGYAVKDYLGMSVQDASDVKGRIIEGCRKRIDKQRGHSRRHAGFNEKWDALTPAEQALLGSNKRSVWTVAPANFKEGHFATFPPDLIKPCIMAGCVVGGTVLDPFFGAGTTGLVSLELGRNCIGIELNPEYIQIAKDRCNVTPGLLLA